MKTIKTIVENIHLPKIIELLKAEGALANTVKIEDQTETRVFKNLFKNQFTYLITTCSPNEKTILVNKIFPVITLLGGICIA